MTLQFQRGDIVLSPPGLSPACYCILEASDLRPRYPYAALNLINLNIYQLPEGGMTKVGTATEAFLKAHTAAGSAKQSGMDPVQELRFRRGQARAEREAWQSTGDDQKKWRALAAAKPGDTIAVRYGCGHAVPHKFSYVVERGSKFVFIADDFHGASFKYALRDLVLDAAQPADSPVGKTGQ